MKKIFLAIFMLVISLLASGCAKMPQKADFIELHAAPAITADEQGGLVYFLREKAFVGGAITYFIQEDTKTIGLLRSGSYFIHKATPGTHTYWAETESKAHVTLEVKPHESYFIIGGVGMGFWAGRPTLAQVTEPVARALLPELKYTRLRTPEEQDRYKAVEEAEKARSMQ